MPSADVAFTRKACCSHLVPEPADVDDNRQLIKPRRGRCFADSLARPIRKGEVFVLAQDSRRHIGVSIDNAIYIHDRTGTWDLLRPPRITCHSIYLFDKMMLVWAIENIGQAEHAGMRLWFYWLIKRGVILEVCSRKAGQ